LYLTRHRQSTVIGSGQAVLGVLQMSLKTGFRLLLSRLTLTPNTRKIYLTDANYVILNVSTVGSVGGVDGLQHYRQD
jgi:hypothetical protein